MPTHTRPVYVHADIELVYCPEVIVTVRVTMGAS